MSEDFAEAWLNLARRTARFTASDFPDIDSDDIEGRLMVFLAERKLLGKDPESEGYAYMLQRAATRLAWEERKDHLALTSQYAYRTRDISNLLESLFESREKWPDAQVPEDARSFENSAGVDGIEMTSDIAWAYSQLPENYQRSIFCRYGLGERPSRGSTEAKALTRAKRRLAEILNWHHRPEPAGPGARRALSNTQARYRLDTQ